MSQTKTSRGLTILELILILPLIGIITILAMTMIVNYNRTYKYSVIQGQTSYQIANYLERMGRVIRSTNDIDSATANSLTIYAYFSPRDATPDKIRYYLSGSDLKVGVIQASGTAPNYTYNPGSEVVTTMVSNVKNGAADLFSYYDENGTKLTGSFNIGSVKEIGIFVSLNPDDKFISKNISGQTKIQLRNKKTNL